MSRGRIGAHGAEVAGEVARLRRRFSTTAPRRWGPTTAAAELSVQVGHLAVCLMRQDGYDVTGLDDPQRPIADLGDELADVVLAAVSIPVLAGVEPVEDPQDQSATSVGEAFLRLLVAAGVLSEVAMVEHHYRHRPEGQLPSLSEASGAVVAACDVLAEHLGRDLLAEFRAMVVDADAFLDQRGDAS